ncbi:MAG: energy-coupling factor transporter transmembrane component T family protein [Christensenellaceae bacterium]
MKSINPSCKLVGILAATILLALFYRPGLNIAVFFVCMALLFWGGAKPKTVGIILIPIAVVAVSMFMTGYHMGSGAHLGIARGVLTDARILNGLQLSSRVLAFAGLGMLFILTTDKMELVRSFEQQLKLPARFAYGILAAWGMLPNMRLEYKRTRAAFYARGIFPGTVSPRLLVPLLVKSVRWSEALSAAMESKGFPEKGERTQYYALKVGVKDRLFVALACGLVVAGLIFWR